MAQNKSPAFQLYVNDWLGSKTITLMTPAEEGAFIRLLAYSWDDEDCGLPDDDKKLLTLSRLTSDDRGAIATLRDLFIPHPRVAGKIINQKLYDLWIERKNYVQAQKEAGERGAKARYSKEKKGVKGRHGVAKASPVGSPKQAHSSSSSSSSSSSKKNKDIYGEFKNVKITKPEYDNLTLLFGIKIRDDFIERLSRWLKRGKKEKDHYATIRTFLCNDNIKPFNICKARNKMPEGAKKSEWKHPKTKEVTNSVTKLKGLICIHCKTIMVGLK